jgi:hypothetical protein
MRQSRRSGGTKGRTKAGAKVRWKAQGKGKSGGVRIIYYLACAEARFLMLTLYAKNELEDLTQAEIRLLKKIVEEWDNG